MYRINIKGYFESFSVFLFVVQYFLLNYRITPIIKFCLGKFAEFQEKCLSL